MLRKRVLVPTESVSADLERIVSVDQHIEELGASSSNRRHHDIHLTTHNNLGRVELNTIGLPVPQGPWGDLRNDC